jgi:hypothetical protein
MSGGRAEVVAEMAFTALILARDMGEGCHVRTAKIVIATLRRGQVPREADVRALHIFTRGAFGTWRE